MVVGLLDALATVVIADHAVRTLVQPLIVILAHVFSQLALSISEMRTKFVTQPFSRFHSLVIAPD